MAPISRVPNGDSSTPLPISPTIIAATGTADGATHLPIPPASAQLVGEDESRKMILELQDGSVYRGFSFGADKSIAAEIVFGTGMVGYPESITDPSYRGQILVVCYPLVGNYGVPSRNTMDSLIESLPAHFESAQIHIAGLVIASYAGEEFSHYLASSSLGTWLKEQQIPAMYGIDTRALTKQIRDQGSMLGKMLLEKPKDDTTVEARVNGYHPSNGVHRGAKDSAWQDGFEEISWLDPNKTNLVAQGEVVLYIVSMQALTRLSFMPRISCLSSITFVSSEASIWT